MPYHTRRSKEWLKKMRNFYQKKDPEERKRILAEKMRDTHCHSCGEKGHWSRECPKNRAQQVLMASSKSRMESNLKAIEEGKEDEWDLLVSLCTGSQHSKPAGVYMAFPCVADSTRLFMQPGSHQHEDHLSFDVLWNLTELRQGVILDLGCMKSVAGTGWANQLVQQWRANGWWFKVIPESEQFRFGNGSTLKSRFSLQFLGTFAERLVVFAFSVVSGDCPPLLSQPACSMLGLTLDCMNHTMSSRRLGVRNYGMKQTLSGHYMMNIGEIEKTDSWIAPDDFCMKPGEEVMIVPSSRAALFQDQDSDQDVCDPSHVPVGRGGLRLGASAMPDLLRVHSPNEEMPDGGGSGSERDQRSLRPAAVRVPSPAAGRGLDVRSLLGQSDEGSGILQFVPTGADRGVGPTGIYAATKETGQATSQRKRARPSSVAARPLPDERRGRADFDPGRDGAGAEEEGEASPDHRSEEGQAGLDRQPGQLPLDVASLELGSGPQHRRKRSFQDADVSMEEDAVDAESEEGLRAIIQCETLEEKQEMAGEHFGQGGGIALWTSGCTEAETGKSGSVGMDVMEEAEETSNATEPSRQSESWVTDELQEEPSFDSETEKLTRPQRGLSQQFKKQIKEALTTMQQVKKVAQTSPKLSVLEIFAGSATLTMVALDMAEWKVYEPVDILLDGGSHDVKDPAVRERLKVALKVLKPDLVIMTPPCGPWSQWQHQRKDFEALERERKDHLPFWRFVADVWEEQTAGGRLALTEQPALSEALDLSMMQRRRNLWRVAIDQCMFGAHDPISKKYYKKPTALDVNDVEWGQLLANWPRCNHRPDEHEQIKGHVRMGQTTIRRSTLAARWPRRLAEHVLETAQAYLQRPPRDADLAWKLHEPTASKDWIEVMVVEDLATPEEVLRRQLQEQGAEGQRFDYVTFEGTARGLPRKLRSTLAHLHVTLGHLSNERLGRMLSLAGGSRALVDGVKQLSCEVCKMVRGPAATPKVSYDKPSTFNQKISGDCFHVWDINNVRYTVAHFLDELTDYQVADVEFDPQSTWIARVLREKWYLVFGTPEVVVTDEGREFKGAVVRLHELCGVLHELVPDQAKWRLGHAERHGAILKIILMKIIVAMQIDTLEEMKWAVTYAVAAKNRLVHHEMGSTASSDGQNFSYSWVSTGADFIRSHQVQGQRRHQQR